MASRDLRARVTDIATCSICQGLFDSPKSLPCLHTFCLKCIEGHCRDNEPGDEVACPLCRQRFNVPDDGVKGLIGNFFIVDLVEARKRASYVAEQVPCEVCLLECDNDDANVADSTMYCVDCNQKLCEQCSRPHRRMKERSHKVVPIGSEVETELIQTRGGKCDKHRDECLKLFCFDDMVNICLMCFAEEHQHHRCKNINAVADECVKQIDADLEIVNRRADGARGEISRLHEDTRKFLADVDSVEDKLAERGEELKQLIDSQVNELMSEVQLLKSQTMKKIDNHRDDIEMKLLMFETFSAYCSELKLKGKPCDIARTGNDLHTRANELVHGDTALADHCMPYVLFTPTNINELLGGRQNFIGRVKLNNSTDHSSCISVVTRERERNTLEQPLAQSTDTEYSLLRQQIEVCHSQLTDNDRMWTLKVNELQAQVAELKSKLESTENSARMLEGKCSLFDLCETDLRAMLENSEQAINNLEEQVEQLRKSESETKIKLVKSENEVERLNSELGELRKSENSLKEELEHERLLGKHQQLLIVPRVVHTLPEAELVLGVTSLEGHLYVLRRKHAQQVEVYSTTTTTTTRSNGLICQQSVPGMLYPCDMTSCNHYRCLYIAECKSSCCVYRVELNGKVTKWPVVSEPCRLSVTSQFTVLVTCDCDNKLIEFTTEGKQLREINLQSFAVHPRHTMKLSSGHFVACHGLGVDPVHRVCIIDTNGHVTRSYGGPPGSATGRLNVPCHLAVDRDGSIFVADRENSRVLLLSPTLNFVREIVSRDQLKWKPWRLFLDVDRRHLYVADNETTGRLDQGRVIVLQLW